MLRKLIATSDFLGVGRGSGPTVPPLDQPMSNAYVVGTQKNHLIEMGLLSNQTYDTTDG